MRSFNSLGIGHDIDRIPREFEAYSQYTCTLSEWKNKNDRNDYVFHYTTLQNAKSILRMMKIKVTEARIKKFGTGVFMTKMEPIEAESTLLHNIYLGNPKYESRLECAFAIHKHHSRAYEFNDPMYPRRDLWKSNNDIHLNEDNFVLVIRKS